MNGLLFKRLYTAGLALLGQGLGTKGTSMKQGKTGMGGRKLYARDERIIVTWKQISVKQGTYIGTKGETRGTGTNRGVSEM